jgi:hypothetical protein
MGIAKRHMKAIESRVASLLTVEKGSLLPVRVKKVSGAEMPKIGLGVVALKLADSRLAPDKVLAFVHAAKENVGDVLSVLLSQQTVGSVVSRALASRLTLWNDFPGFRGDFSVVKIGQRVSDEVVWGIGMHSVAAARALLRHVEACLQLLAEAGETAGLDWECLGAFMAAARIIAGIVLAKMPEDDIDATIDRLLGLRLDMVQVFEASCSKLQLSALITTGLDFTTKRGCAAIMKMKLLTVGKG